MKHLAIGKLRVLAEKDLRISHCARTLLFRLYSACYTDPHREAGDPFPLPWTTIAHWCGLTDRHTATERAEELVRAGYLWDEGLKGCPPMKIYKLNLRAESSLGKLIVRGVIPPLERRLGNRDASVRKGLAGLRAAAA